ncbi:MAG: glycosyltransferase family 9 protein [Chthoniobacter sp.]|uniref:glycosyltransferase family 9 protein n=1 Tax=Chthoniobacter sp. TaxID=2510640 RepID=UPI0032AC82C2
MATPAQSLKLAAAPLLGFFNRARLGFPRHYFQGAGGIGDDLLCTAVFHELRKRRARGIVVNTQHSDLFRGSPDVDAVIDCPRPRLSRWLREGLPFVPLSYADYDPVTDRDQPPAEHVLAIICRLAGLTGQVALRPYLFLAPEERAAGRLADKQIVMQSSGQAAAHFMQNKEWLPDRFREVCGRLRETHTIVQIGSAQDPLLEGAVDLRGQTSLRQSAAILTNSAVFIGLVGFLMHLARAVDCRGVIVYGGRERPEQTGYVANINLIGNPPCSPCWLRNRCDFDHICMQTILPEVVFQATRKQIVKQGIALETETALL